MYVCAGLFLTSKDFRDPAFSSSALHDLVKHDKLTFHSILGGGDYTGRKQANKQTSVVQLQ